LLYPNRSNSVETLTKGCFKGGTVLLVNHRKSDSFKSSCKPAVAPQQIRKLSRHYTDIAAKYTAPEGTQYQMALPVRGRHSEKSRDA